MGLAAGLAPPLLQSARQHFLARAAVYRLAAQLEAEAQALARIARTADAWEGMTAFMQKRSAKFEGK